MCILTCQKGLIAARLLVVVGLLFVARSFGLEHAADTGRQDRRDEAEVGAWNIKEPAEAKELALCSVGLKQDVAATAKLVTLEGDETSFLADHLVGRPLWQVLLENWSIAPLKSSPPGARDWYRRTLDVFLDPTNGQVLKIKSHCLDNVPKLRPGPDAKSAAAQMFGCDKERYHGFPSEPPLISFMEAIRVVQRGGGNPRAAKQIIGHWVLWSEKEKPARPMWVITLRGIPPIDAHRPGVPEYFRDNMRYVVDPVAKKWLVATNTPYLLGPRAAPGDE